MSLLLPGNIDSGTTDDEIKAFLVKYGFPPFDEIEHVSGDGARPARDADLPVPRSGGVAQSSAAHPQHVLERPQGQRAGHGGAL